MNEVNAVVMIGFNLANGTRCEPGDYVTFGKKDLEYLTARGAVMDIAEYEAELASALAAQDELPAEVQEEPASIVGDQTATELKE